MMSPRPAKPRPRCSAPTTPKPRTNSVSPPTSSLHFQDARSVGQAGRPRTADDERTLASAAARSASAANPTKPSVAWTKSRPPVAQASPPAPSQDRPTRAKNRKSSRPEIEDTERRRRRKARGLKTWTQAYEQRQRDLASPPASSEPKPVSPRKPTSPHEAPSPTTEPPPRPSDPQSNSVQLRGARCPLKIT